MCNITGKHIYKNWPEALLIREFNKFWAEYWIMRWQAKQRWGDRGNSKCKNPKAGNRRCNTSLIWNRNSSSQIKLSDKILEVFLIFYFMAIFKMTIHKCPRKNRELYFQWNQTHGCTFKVASVKMPTCPMVLISI